MQSINPKNSSTVVARFFLSVRLSSRGSFAVARSPVRSRKRLSHSPDALEKKRLDETDAKRTVVIESMWHFTKAMPVTLGDKQSDTRSLAESFGQNLLTQDPEGPFEWNFQIAFQDKPSRPSSSSAITAISVTILNHSLV